jgi:hypothetical protein
MNPIKGQKTREGARKRIIRPLSLGVALAHHGAAFSLFADGPKGLVKPRLHLIRRNKKEFPPSTHTHTHKITKEKKKKKEYSKQKQERAIKKLMFFYPFGLEKAIEYHHHTVGDLIMWCGGRRYGFFRLLFFRFQLTVFLLLLLV